MAVQPENLPVAEYTMAFNGEQGPSTAATLSTALAGANNDLDFTAVTAGADGNDITIAYIDPAAISQALAVSVSGTAITVSLATDGAGVITSTAAQVDAAIDTAGLLASTTATDLDINEIWHDNAPDASVEAIAVLAEKVVAQNIIQTVGTAGVTDGTLVYCCLWKPISSDGNVA